MPAWSWRRWRGVDAVSFLWFDFSVWEIWGALLHGGRLVVVPEEVTRSPEDFHALLVSEHVSVLTQTPSAVAVLSPEGLESTALVIGAEPCPAELVDRWAPGRVMINVYGPTETTMWVSMSAPLTPGSGALPIGRRWRGRRCLCWMGGCARCRPGWSGSCMWPVAAWGCGYVAPGRVDRVAVCGVSVRRRGSAGGADVSHRGSGVLGC